MTLFMVLSSWHSHCESSPGSFDECRLSARWTGRLNPDTVTHPSTNWARRRLTSFVETNVLLLYQTTTIWWPPSSSHKCRTVQTLRPRQPTRAASPPECCYHALVKSLTRCYWSNKWALGGGRQQTINRSASSGKLRPFHAIGHIL